MAPPEREAITAHERADALAGHTIAFTLRRRERPASEHGLTLVQGSGVGRWVPLGAEPLVLGRDPSLPFCLPGDEVSRSHCEVRLAGERALVRDLRSTNGTFVDGRRVEGEVELPPAALLQLGGWTLRHDVLTPEEAEQRARLAADLERAQRYVGALIPAPLAQGPVRTEWCLVPSSQLGGDALGYHALAGGRMALYVLDVCGHGVDSALHSASILNTLRAHNLTEADFGEPASVLARLNEAFAMEEHDGMVFTIWYGVLDPARRTLCFASAGHPPALALAADGSALRRLGTSNPPIGALGPRPFAQAEASFAPGERLYVFSDGAYELVDPEGREQGLEDLERRLAAGADRSPGEPERLYRSALRASGATALRDDFTLLVVTLEPGD